MTEIHVTVRSETTQYRLSAYARRLTRMRSLWRSVGSDLAKLQRSWWASKGQGSWPPRRTPATNPLMVRSGKLLGRMTSARHFLVTRGENQAEIVIPREVFYGRFHQTGTRYLPQRRVIAPLSETRRAVQTAARRHAQYRRAR